MAHAWWHIRTGPEYGTEEFYDQPGEPDVAAAMDWARIRAEQEGREPNWKDILAYWTTEDPLANPQALAARYEADRMGVSQEEAAYAGLPERDITPDYMFPGQVTSKGKEEEEKEEKEPDLLNRLFLMSLMENMQGGDIGQAPAVVAGGGRREFPTMMRQFAPWEREKPYWWLR